MAYLLTCSCGKEHSVSPSQAGQEIECDCGTHLRVPTLRGLRQLPAVGDSVAPEPSEATKSTWRGWRGPALACATGIALVAATSAAYFLIQRTRIDTSFTEESALSLGNDLLDEYGPYELSYVWNEYEMNGLGLKQRPTYYYWNEYAKDLVFRSKIMGSIALVFGCLAAVVWFIAKKT